MPALNPRAFHNNRYQVESRIGSGGMAEVYRAHDTTLDRAVAIKVMRPELAGDLSFFERFKNEAKAAARLTDSHVVKIFDWGQDGPECYIVMEYVRGIDLKAALDAQGVIHPWRVADIASQVCQALQEAHENGVVHCDIKPANLILQKSGEVKVMDFGIAQSRRHITGGAHDSVLGTVHYMSPQQIRGERANAQCDIYSLGITMYELSTNRLPFIGKDVNEVIEQQQFKNPIAPLEFNWLIDEDLNEIILKAMSKDTRSRYKTARELQVVLEEYLEAESHPMTRLPFPKYWVGAVTAGEAAAAAEGTLFKIDRPVVIGRSSSADVRIIDNTVSAAHVRLTPYGRYLEVDDLKSSNGTVLDGKPVQCKTLCQAGATIEMGNTRIRIGCKMGSRSA